MARMYDIEMGDKRRLLMALTHANANEIIMQCAREMMTVEAVHQWQASRTIFITNWASGKSYVSVDTIQHIAYISCRL